MNSPDVCSRVEGVGAANPTDGARILKDVVGLVIGIVSLDRTVIGRRYGYDRNPEKTGRVRLIAESEFRAHAGIKGCGSAVVVVFAVVSRREYAHQTIGEVSLVLQPVKIGMDHDGRTEKRQWRKCRLVIASRITREGELIPIREVMVNSSRDHIRAQRICGAAGEICTWQSTVEVGERIDEVEKIQTLRTNPAGLNLIACKCNSPGRILCRRRQLARRSRIVNRKRPIGKIALTFLRAGDLELLGGNRLPDAPSLIAAKPESPIFPLVDLGDPYWSA